MTTRILLVEDNEDLAFGIRKNLEFDGYEVEVIQDGSDALARGLERAHDLVVLDLMLPGLDGLSILQRLRAAGVAVPILILTARSEERDTVLGLRAGADDYLTKPFGISELMARIEALLRRSKPSSEAAPDRIHRFGSVEVDGRCRTVHRNGQPVTLTPRELDLLLALLDGEGAALSRYDLLRDVWGHKAEVETRTIDTHIGELRRKLEDDPRKPKYILTVRKHGYRIVAGTGDLDR